MFQLLDFKVKVVVLLVRLKVLLVLRFYLGRVHLLLLVVDSLKGTILREVLLLFDLVLLLQLLDRSLVEL